MRSVIQTMSTHEFLDLGTSLLLVLVVGCAGSVDDDSPSVGLAAGATPTGTGATVPPGAFTNDAAADAASTNGGVPTAPSTQTPAAGGGADMPSPSAALPSGDGTSASDEPSAPSLGAPTAPGTAPIADPPASVPVWPPPGTDGGSEDPLNPQLDATPGDTGSTSGTPVEEEPTSPEPVPTTSPHRKFVGNITTGNGVDTDGLSFARHWDQITPENAGKWGSVQSRAGANFNWGTLDAIYDYAEANGLIFKEHTFVWGSQQPGGSIGESDVKNWMNTFCQRYPNTALIDVVNEPPPHTNPSYADAIGGGSYDTWQWITNAFVWAREACPEAILLLNDFNNIEWSTDHRDFLNIVKTIQAAGAPIDAIGAQAHDLDHPSVSFETVKQYLQELHDETGLPLYITEYDISTSDDGAQLDAYSEHIPYFLETDYVHGVTIWGWIYGRTWGQASESGLIRNGSPRSAMTWLMTTLDRPVP